MPRAPQSNSSKTPSLMAFTRKPLLRTANSLCIPKARSCFCRDLDPENLPVRAPLHAQATIRIPRAQQPPAQCRLRRHTLIHCRISEGVE